MDHRKVLIETSIVIEHLRKKDKRKSLLFNIIDANELSVSSITVFQLFAGATDEKKKGT